MNFDTLPTYKLYKDFDGDEERNAMNQTKHVDVGMGYIRRNLENRDS